MTFADLRALHALIGNAIDDIEHVYALASADRQTPSAVPHARTHSGHHNAVFPLLDSSAYASPPPSPHVAVPDPHPSEHPATSDPHILDFPSLDAPCDPTSLPELLTTDPLVVRAINHIVAAAGQLSATVQAPFLSICDASMAVSNDAFRDYGLLLAYRQYHLPSCLRLLEASHTVEILREAGTDGLHVSHISKQSGVEETKLGSYYFDSRLCTTLRMCHFLAHALRLLATHHIVRETAPDVFATNRISSLLSTGKSLAELRKFEESGR